MICRLCMGKTFRVLYKKNHYSVFQCIACGFGTLSPIPSNSALKLLYNSPDYHADKTTIEHERDSRKKMEYVNKWLLPNATILDYGCGTGDVMKAARMKGFIPFGFDIAPTTAREASQKSGCPTTSGNPSLKLYGSASIDAITSFDVIEHIVDFKSILHLWNQWLKPGGLVIITTPNLSSWDHAFFGKHWYGFTKIPQHINYFDHNSIRTILHEAGFEIVEKRTWGFSRSIRFIIRQLPCGEMFVPILKFLHLQNHFLYMPMIDMMVVARKV